MIEIAMCICLTLMGIYFFKSTDIPQELKDKSAQMRALSKQQINSPMPKKMNLKKETTTKIQSNEINHAKLAELNLLKKAAELKLLHEEIDKLTMTITALEQEIKENNERNSEIQNTIDSHLISLQSLQEKIVSLS